MVKGVNKQVIVVHSPEEKLFEQAIFILKEGTVGVSDEVLLKEADRLIRSGRIAKTPKRLRNGPLWAAGGAALTAAAWILSGIL